MRATTPLAMGSDLREAGLCDGSLPAEADGADEQDFVLPDELATEALERSEMDERLKSAQQRLEVRGKEIYRRRLSPCDCSLCNTCQPQGIWNKLSMPSNRKMDMAIKYSSPVYTEAAPIDIGSLQTLASSQTQLSWPLDNVIDLWDRAADLIIQVRGEGG